MRGHDPLIAMRRKHRVKPGLAFVDLVDRHSPVAADWQEHFCQAHIEVTDAESIARLDLRCIVGMAVIVSGFDAGRVSSMHDACVAAGAKHVVSMVMEDRGGEIKTTQMRDSASERLVAARG